MTANAESLESFIEDLLSGKADDQVAMIDLIIGDENGKQVYCYTRVGFSKYAAYKEACHSGRDFDPADYGEIIAHGEGTPPPHIVSELKQKYAFQDNFEQNLTDISNGY